MKDGNVDFSGYLKGAAHNHFSEEHYNYVTDGLSLK